MADMPSSDVVNAPLEEFIDPQSAIASILGQMQGAADRSKPIETIQNANRAVPTRKFNNVDDLLQLLLAGR